MKILIEESVLRQALEALEYHTEQTRPIHGTDAAIRLLHKTLDAAEKVEPVGEVDQVDVEAEGGSYAWVNLEYPIELGTKLYTHPAPAVPEKSDAFGRCLLEAAAKSGNEGAIRLAAQLADIAPCPDCDYRKEYCRCSPVVPTPPANTDSELRTGGRFEDWLLDFDNALAKENKNERKT